MTIFNVAVYLIFNQSSVRHSLYFCSIVKLQQGPLMGSNPRPPLYESDTLPTAPHHTAAWYVFNWKIKHFFLFRLRSDPFDETTIKPRCPYQNKKTTTLPPDYIRYETSMNTYLPSPWLQLSLLHSLYLQCIFISIKSYIRTFAFYRLLVSITVHDSWVDHQNN